MTTHDHMHSVNHNWVYSERQRQAVLQMQEANAEAAREHQLELAQVQAAAIAAQVIPAPPTVAPPTTPVSSSILDILGSLFQNLNLGGSHGYSGGRFGHHR